MYPEKQTFMVRPDPNLSGNSGRFLSSRILYDGVANRSEQSSFLSCARMSLSSVRKDYYQQLKIIPEHVVKQFGMPLKIIPDGTSKKSGNRLGFYLPAIAI